MVDKMKYPICGKENRYVYFDESILGGIEEYYSCDNCGYNLEKYYSNAHEWIDLDKWDVNKLKELWNSQSINAVSKEKKKMDDLDKITQLVAKAIDTPREELFL